MAAKAALSSWLRELHYDGQITIHVADDGSTLLDYPRMLGSLVESHVARHDIEMPIEFSRGERKGVGASLNRAFRAGFERGDLVLYLVDDWLLASRYDLNPWARMLVEREDIGMVRLGPPHPHLTGTIEALTEDYQGWGLVLDRHHFAFGHRPALYHQRMIDAYGWFSEGVNAYDCERLYAERYSISPPWHSKPANGAPHGSPDIVYALPHPWHHLGTTEFAHIEPGAE
jgi:hypothetical protein